MCPHAYLHVVLWRIMTYTGQIRLATTWIFASRAMRRNGSLSTGHSFAEKEKKEEERGVFASIGQEASMGASISDASQRSARWSKVVGVLEHPEPLETETMAGDVCLRFNINCLSIG